jgi:hypothetical protein
MVTPSVLLTLAANLHDDAFVLTVLRASEAIGVAENRRDSPRYLLR